MSLKLDALEKGLSGFGVQLFAIENMVCHLLCMSIYKETIKRGSPDHLGAIVMENENLIKKQLGKRLRDFDGSNELRKDILAYQQELLKQIKYTIEDEIKQLKALADGTSSFQ